MKTFSVLTAIMLFCVCISTAQEKFEIRLVPTNVSHASDVLCFDTQFKNISDMDVEFAGQNYRLFYDALQLKFQKSAIKSHLPKETYGMIDLNQSLHNIDARGYGNLQFSQNLGFINYSLRTTDDLKKIITLPPHSGWLSTTNICFKATDPLGPMNLIWGRDGLTDGYATAFTEVAVLDENKIDKTAMIQVYQDFIKLSDGTSVNDPMVLQSTKNR